METWSVELAGALQNRGHEIDLRALPGGADGVAPGPAAILVFGFRQAVSLIFGRGGWQVIQGGDMALWPLVLLARLRAGRAVPAVIAAHGTDVAFAARPGGAARLYRLWLRAAVRCLPGVRVAANSRATADRARTLGFRDVQVVQLAVHAGPPVPPPPPEPFLLFAGRLVQRKGLSWFVRAVLPGLPEGLILKVAGTVWDASEGEALAAPRVEAVGPLPQAELHRLMARATAVVIPNIPAGPGHFEGFGLVAPEAAAAGAVVLAADLDGFRDSVIEGATGFLLPPAEAGPWISRIEEITAWPLEARARFTTKAQAAARTHFSWDRVVRQMEVLYGAADR